MIPKTFTEENYKAFLEYLYSLEDIKYKEFHSKLIMNNELIGIRTPELKKIASLLAKGDYKNFIKYNTKNTYEEKVLYGLVLGYLKIDFNKRLELLSTFIPYIDNWAVNDIVCANMKCFKKNQSEGYKFIITCLESNNPWHIRFGLVLLLDFYINDNYIDQILVICNTIKNNNYYVKMAVAWLLSICYIKYKDKTLQFLKVTSLDDWTYNKAIQKMIESTRVGNQEKLNLKKLKR